MSACAKEYRSGRSVGARIAAVTAVSHRSTTVSSSTWATCASSEMSKSWPTTAARARMRSVSGPRLARRRPTTSRTLTGSPAARRSVAAPQRPSSRERSHPTPRGAGESHRRRTGCLRSLATGRRAARRRRRASRDRRSAPTARGDRGRTTRVARSVPRRPSRCSAASSSLTA